jgi:cob(I)alamin adenosyltransferase
MKIYTKKGDQGFTSLIGGTRVPKSSLRIETYGTVDELNSFTGLVKDVIHDEKAKEELFLVQNHLFNIGALLASDPDTSKMNLPGIEDEDIEMLENGIDRMNEDLPELRNFILPGGHPNISYCHLARCVCRRAERITVALDQEQKVDNLIIKFLNRLSDYFFVLARKEGKDIGIEEVKWQKLR